MTDDQRARIREHIERCEHPELDHYIVGLVLEQRANIDEVTEAMATAIAGATPHVQAFWLDEPCPCCHANNN